MSNQADYKLLCASSLGEELSEQECKVLAGIMGVRQLDDGELLVSESGSDHTLFVLIDGHLDVISKSGDREEVVYTMLRGECAGTRAFVDRTPRKATLRASEQATVYTLEPDDFESLLKSHPEIVYKVMRALFRITHINLLRMNQESQQLANYIAKTRGRY